VRKLWGTWAYFLSDFPPKSTDFLDMKSRQIATHLLSKSAMEKVIKLNDKEK
jgi:hypothetical protein